MAANCTRKRAFEAVFASPPEFPTVLLQLQQALPVTAALRSSNMPAAHRSLLALAALVLLLSVSVRESHAGERAMCVGMSHFARGTLSGWRRRRRAGQHGPAPGGSGRRRPQRMWPMCGLMAPLGSHAAHCMHSPHSHAPSPPPVTNPLTGPPRNCRQSTPSPIPHPQLCLSTPRSKSQRLPPKKLPRAAGSSSAEACTM